MNTQKKTVRDLDVSGKKVLLRCDFNVPLDKATGAITDDKRIAASLPTIQYLLQHGAAVIACSHLGRPKGQVKPELSLRPVAERLSQLLGQPVALAADVAGPDSVEKAAALQPGQVLLLENLRFRPEEEANDPDFAKALASLADVFVSDAFGTVHRAHASTAGVAAYLPAVAGLLVEKELQFLGGALNEPKRPFVSILGGSKVSDKIGVLESLLTKADAILIGGGMSYTFTKALGGHIGASLCEEDKLDSTSGRRLPKPTPKSSLRQAPWSGMAPWAFSNSPPLPRALRPWRTPWLRQEPSPSSAGATPPPPPSRWAWPTA